MTATMLTMSIHSPKEDVETVTTNIHHGRIRTARYNSEVRHKQDIQESWMRNKTQVVVATIDFGIVKRAAVATVTPPVLVLKSQRRDAHVQNHHGTQQ